MKKIYFLMFAFVLAFGVSGSSLAWDGPTAQPPGNNKAAPINGSSNFQTKDGRLDVSGLLPPARASDQRDFNNFHYGLRTPSRLGFGALCFPSADGLGECKYSWSEIIGGGGSTLWEEITSGSIWIRPKSSKAIKAENGFILENRTSNPSVTAADAGRMWFCTANLTTTCKPDL